MTLKIERIIEDLADPAHENQILALTTIPRIASQGGLTPEHFEDLLKKVGALTRSDNSDISFLARKAENVLRTLRTPARPPPGPAATQDTLQRTAQQLVTAIKNESDSTKLATLLTGLKKLGDRSVVSQISSYVSHMDPRVRSNAVECVEELGDKSYISVLLPLLSDENNRVRANVAKALGKWGVPETVDCLKDMLHSEQVAQRESGLYAVAELDNIPGVELVEHLVADPYEGVRNRVVAYLSRQQGEKATELLKFMAQDVHPDIRQKALDALGARGVEPDDVMAPDATVRVSSTEVVESVAVAAEGAGVDTPPPDHPAHQPGSTSEVVSPDLSEITAHADPALAHELEESLSRAVNQIARDLLDQERRATLSRALFVNGAKGFMRVKNGEVKHPEAVQAFYEVMKVQQFLKESLVKLRGEKLLPEGQQERIMQMTTIYNEHLKLAFLRLGKVLFLLTRQGQLPATPETAELVRLGS